MAELLHTSLPGLPSPRVGKVREVYDLGNELLIVATDRISAFDVVMINGIPDKGAILNQLSAFWFGKLGHICPNHFGSIDAADIDDRLGSVHPELHGRSLLAQKAIPLPVESVARGYLTGSLYKEYVKEGGKVHGLDLPEGLKDGDRLPSPIFSPATKATEGHDENIGFASVVNVIGEENANQIRDWTLRLYQEAAAHAEKVGIIIADTKFEFGETEHGLILIDEALTPDSSRFWDITGSAVVPTGNARSPGASGVPDEDVRSPHPVGVAHPSFDKQFVRNYLETLDWNKQPPGPTLPPDVVEGTRARYVEAYERITGERFG